MTAYILIFLAVLCFTGQFAFTKIYEGAIKQTVSTSLVMLTVTGTFGAALYLLIGGFRLQFSAISVLYAAIFALVMIPYYVIGIKALSYGSLAIYGMFMMLGGMLIPFFLRDIHLKRGYHYRKTARHCASHHLYSASSAI